MNFPRRLPRLRTTVLTGCLFLSFHWVAHAASVAPVAAENGMVVAA